MSRAAAAGDLFAFLCILLVVLLASSMVAAALDAERTLEFLLWSALPIAGLMIAGTTWLIRRQGRRWHDFGLHWSRGAGRLVIDSFAVVGTVYLLLYLLHPLFGGAPGAEPDIGLFAGLEGNWAELLLALLVVWTAAAIAEELLFRGFLMNRLAQLFGGGHGAWIAAALAQGALFGAAHAYQGPAGMWLTGIMGCAFGLAFLAVGRSLVPLIVAHGTIDTLSLIQIFRGGLGP